MKRLSKDQLERKDGIAAQLRMAATDLESEIDEANDSIRAAREKVAKAIREYNEAVTEAKKFCDEIAGNQRSFFEERSERWQESIAGQAYERWMREWEALPVMDVIEEPTVDLIDAPDADHADLLDELPDDWSE